MGVDIERIYLAYRKLKSSIYYDKTDLSLRKRLADFECGDDFEERLQSVLEVVSSEAPEMHLNFKDWIKEIDFRISPKKFKCGDSITENDVSIFGRYITNVTTVSKIDVEKVNYFFDGPIELHIIAVLWIMQEGRFLDAQFGVECCGSRLVDTIHESSDDGLTLFRKYHEQYSRWRDSGIRKAKEMLTEYKVNVAILGLDIQEYFYRIRLDFKSVVSAINIPKKEFFDDEMDDVPPLLACIEKIYRKYRRVISSSLALTHQDLGELDTGVPIGICSSLVLVNWYLKDFDDAVKKWIRPSYYGRYVDDILIVVPVVKDPELEDGSPVSVFLDDLLVKTGLLSAPENHRYELKSRDGLYLQQGKCILQYFESKHSIAGLEKFQEKLEQNGSDFLLLPVDEADNSLEDVAFELIYEGSVNKFRSIKGVAENRYELAKHLARQTILHLYTNDKPDPAVSLGLRKFFKGKNSVEFYDLWERVFTFFAIAGDPKSAKAFDKHLKSELKRVRFSGSADISKLLTNSLARHLDLSKSMANALCEQDWGLSDLIPGYDIEVFRNSNMIRHHFLRKPLINYTTFKGPLASQSPDSQVDIDESKLDLTPRFLNFDECLLLANSNAVKLGGMSEFSWAAYIYEIANRQEVLDIEWHAASPGGSEAND